MRCLAIAAIFLFACAALQTAQPKGELVVVGLSSNRRLELARELARARAVDRAATINNPNGIAFALDRSRGKPLLKLVSTNVSLGLAPEIEPRKPAGARATLKLTRSEDVLRELRALPVVHSVATASGLDLAVLQERADRAVLRDAILRFALAAGRREHKLFGHVRFVNYHASEADGAVRVDADLNVRFGDEAVLREVRESKISEEREEVEPPEESK